MMWQEYEFAAVQAVKYDRERDASRRAVARRLQNRGRRVSRGFGMTRDDLRNLVAERFDLRGRRACEAEGC